MLQETIEIHEQMIELLDGTLADSEDSVWIQDVVFYVDTCNSEVNKYLELRKGDPFSKKRSVT